MPGKKPTSGDATPPDQKKLNDLQVKRLSALAGIDIKELEGMGSADLQNKLRWRIDPELFLFRRICGKVVKKDAITGVEYPVPFATVIVEDTDCSFVSYFPGNWPWGWLFPLFCHRETLATVKTDKCGQFCVWIPRFDIDWILHWRRLRICFPFFFRRPTIKDLIDKVRVQPFPPSPDPGPFAGVSSLSLSTLEAMGGSVARHIADQFKMGKASRAFGAPAELLELAETRAFDRELPPPLPEEFRRVLGGHVDVGSQSKANPVEAIRSAVALRLGVDPRNLEYWDVNRCIGPFYRCFDIYFQEWQLIHDVPDVTFQVTQDINGDGVEETIYSESFFDVRWDAEPIPNVKLVASSSARESRVCSSPDLTCGNIPAILFAGLMPLNDANYFDGVAGYATRPNRPIAPSGARTGAQTPFLQTLQLFGCVNIPSAKYYRVLSSSDNGTTFSAITGLRWNIYPIPAGPPQWVDADPDGWYPVLANPEAFHPSHMVLEWPTPTIGRYLLRIEIGDAAKNFIQKSADIAIHVDNTSPTVIFTNLRWKFSAEPDGAFSLPGRSLLESCPVIHRGTVPQDVDVQFDATVVASHLRQGNMYVSSCDGAPLPPLATPTPHTGHWHEYVTDNSQLLTARYRIFSGDKEGSYTFGCLATSRGMNPSGGDGGHLADWFYDPVFVLAEPEIRVAIVNA